MRKNIYIVFLALFFCIGYLPSANALYVKNTKVSKNNNFLGNWYMQTIVISSDCPYIMKGTTTESKLLIQQDKVRNPNLLKAVWVGGKWSDSKGKIKLLSEKEAITERTTNFKTEDNDTWKSILIDHLKVIEEDTLQSESIVIQYKNGKPVGEYTTFSILTKIN